ncbi:MAG: YerC/YecD family TrpR-related protein [Patescibacteria group bacterium]|jgi:TrpR-related protein YerC/YecD
MVKARTGVVSKFKQSEHFSPRNIKEENLTRAFASLKDTAAAAALMRDMLTPAEIEEFANRLEMARLIFTGSSYKEIAKKLKTSTATVTRVAHWLYRGCGGYFNFLTKQKSNS